MILKIDISAFGDAAGPESLDIPGLESEMRHSPEMKDLLECGVARVVLSFFSKAEIKKLNARYRSVSEPTDVLSFPLWEEDGVFSPPPWRDELPLGDVVISPEFVRDNALSLGVGCDGEMALVAIHGILHLVGFDHDTEERRIVMWDVQERMRKDYFRRRIDGDWED